MEQSRLNWMANVDGNTTINMLTIPGTHDSGAYTNKYAGIGKCQDYDIIAQLENGIRFLDIRISNMIEKQNDFEVRHGKLKLGSFNKLVWGPVLRFMHNHNTETIFMSIKKEGPLDVLRLENQYVYSKNSIFFQGPVHPFTKLDDVRGTVVLINRFNSNFVTGINWQNSFMNIQDDYELDGFWYRLQYHVDYAKKEERVLKHLINARDHQEGPVIYLNFASASWKGIKISYNADFCNTVVKRFFLQCTHPIGSFIIMDYPNRVENLIDSVIKNNFLSKRRCT